MADSDEIIFAITIVKCVLIVSCGSGTIVYLAWAGGKRMFSDKDGPASHSAEEAEASARLQPLHAHAQHSLLHSADALLGLSALKIKLLGRALTMLGTADIREGFFANYHLRRPHRTLQNHRDTHNS